MIEILNKIVQDIDTTYNISCKCHKLDSEIIYFDLNDKIYNLNLKTFCRFFSEYLLNSENHKVDDVVPAIKGLLDACSKADGKNNKIKETIKIFRLIYFNKTFSLLTNNKKFIATMKNKLAEFVEDKSLEIKYKIMFMSFYFAIFNLDLMIISKKKKSYYNKKSDLENYIYDANDYLLDNLG